MNNDVLEIFKNELGDVRIIKGNNPSDTLFCAKDVASCLGYSRERDAIQRHCRYAVKHGVSSTVQNQYGLTNSEKTIEMTFITLGDVARLISHSKLPSAVRFEKWLYDEVFPAIYETGNYKYNYDINFDRTNPFLSECVDNVKVIEEVNKMFQSALPFIINNINNTLKSEITNQVKSIKVEINKSREPVPLIKFEDEK